MTLVVKHTPRYFDEEQYLFLAEHVAKGDGYVLPLYGQLVPSAFRPPTWPMLLAVGLWVGLPVWTFLLLQVAILAGCALVARDIAKWIAGEAAGWIACFGVLVYPLNAYTALTLYPQLLSTLLMLVAIQFCLRWASDARSDASKNDIGAFAVFGGILSSLFLAVPTMTSVIVILFIAGGISNSGRLLRYAFSTIFVFLIPVAAWTIRNLVVLGQPVFLSTAAGYNLLLGNNPNAGAATGVSADLARYIQTAQGLRLSEVATNDYYTQSAISWALGNKTDALALYLAKFANYFAPYNAPQSGGGSTLALGVAVATFVPLVALTAARFFLRAHLPIGPFDKLTTILFVSSGLFMAAAFTRTRFRQPLDTLLIVEAAISLSILLFLTRNRKNTSSPADEAQHHSA